MSAHAHKYDGRADLRMRNCVNSKAHAMQLTSASHLMQTYRGKTSVFVVSLQNCHLGGVQLRLWGDAWSL